jgi:hypothetical protein
LTRKKFSIFAKVENAKKNNKKIEKDRNRRENSFHDFLSEKSKAGE